MFCFFDRRISQYARCNHSLEWHSGSGDCQSISGRVVRIEGRAGNKLDYLRIRFIEDYTPSYKVDVPNGLVSVIYDFVAPGESRLVVTTSTPPGEKPDGY